MARTRDQQDDEITTKQYSSRPSQRAQGAQTFGESPTLIVAPTMRSKVRGEVAVQKLKSVQQIKEKAAIKAAGRQPGTPVADPVVARILQNSEAELYPYIVSKPQNCLVVVGYSFVSSGLLDRLFTFQRSERELGVFRASANAL